MSRAGQPFTISTADGLELVGDAWEPRGTLAAAVTLIHGLGDHRRRYGTVVEAFTRAGIAVTAADLRGHGESPGPRGHAPNYDTLLDDVERAAAATAARWPHAPQILFGNSFGGNLVLNLALRRAPPAAGIIATAPALRPAFDPPAWKLAVGRIAYRLWPRLTLGNEVDEDALSRDPAVIEANKADDLTHNRVSAQLGIDLLEAGEYALAHAARFPLPLLLMHGTGDRVTSAPATAEFAERAGDGCTLRLFEGLYHELHNEPEREEVLAALVGWIEAVVDGKK